MTSIGPSRSRAALSRLAALLCLAAAGLPAAAQPAERARPNIIFIFSDDHGWQAISAYGSNRNRTPHLDRIAAEGMRFDRCYVSNSICAPSRAAILTGLHNHLNGNTTNERLFDNRQRMFPRMLQQAGYQTAIIGKYHLRTEPVGFDYWDTLINQGTYYNPWMIRNGQKRRLTGYTTDIVTDLAIDWLADGRSADKPFMLMVQHKSPHRQWDPGPDHLTLFDDRDLPEPATLFDPWENRSSAWSHAEMSIEHHLNPGDLHLETPSWQLNDEQEAAWEAAYGPKNEAFHQARLSGDALTRWKYQRYAKDYLRCVQSIDDNVGRLLDYLDEAGLADNTIVIYNSDQGWYLGEHGFYDKRWMYEESYRAPLLVRWPGVTPASAVNTDLVQNIDFAPTFLDLAGIAVPPDMQGVSLRPLLEGRTPDDWRTSLYYHFYEDLGAHRVPRHCGVSTQRYKLIHFYTLDEWELFDLQQDPDELVSVYDDPAYADVRRELERELARLRDHYRVTDHADQEYERFAALLERRRAFLRLLGRTPYHVGFGPETLATDEQSAHVREQVRYRVGDQQIAVTVLRPRNATGVSPAVAIGHPALPADSADAFGSVAPLAEALCARGFVVAVPERLGYAGRASRAPDRAVAAREMLMAGSSLLGQEVQELWAACEYLSRRDDVHAKRVGVLGVGEGGLVATLVAMLNEECWAAAAIDGLHPFDASLADPGVCDLLTIQGIRDWGRIDHAIEAAYPRPFLAISTQRDDAALLDVARAQYQERNFSDRLDHLHVPGIDPAGDPGVRDRVVAWFDRWLMQAP